MNKSILFKYILHHADNALILAQRNSEWTGHGPVLEQDIAITNISLDLLGLARNLYELASTIHAKMNSTELSETDYLIPAIWKTYNRILNEDDLAFLRDERQYLNFLITELPRGDWAFTILRQFFFSTFQQVIFQTMLNSQENQLSAIAEKSLKEISYHIKWSSEWVIRLGDGTLESHHRISTAINDLWKYTGEFFIPSGFEDLAFQENIITSPIIKKEDWLAKVNHITNIAGLHIPESNWMHSGGKEGKHTEHLGYLLAEMQYMQRAYPNLTW